MIRIVNIIWSVRLTIIYCVMISLKATEAEIYNDEEDPMNNTEKLRVHIESCGITGVKVLQQEAEGEQYRDELIKILEIMKTVTADEIRAAGYPVNIQNTLLMDRHLIDDTVTEEIDQLSLLNTVVTYIECNAEGMPEHSAKYMDRVTDLRKILESVYEKEAMDAKDHGNRENERKRIKKES